MNKIESFEYGEERSQRLLRYLTDYIFTVQIENGKVVETYHGPGCIAVTGYSSEDFTKDPDLWYRMVFDEDKEAVLEQARKASAGEEVEPLEHRIVHHDGLIRWVKNSIVLAKDHEGNVVSYDGIINDITELKHAEALADVKQKQLIQADKMVSLGILVSGIAHEINNPNNFIMLNAELILKAWEDILPILMDYYDDNGDFAVAGMSFHNSHVKFRGIMKGISEGANRIQKITRSLTNFAKHDPGELNQSVDLNWIIENAIIITGNLVKNSTNNFTVRYNKNTPNVTGNKQQLEQVIINLINNACQSLTNKKQSITVTLFYDKYEESLITEVKDEGAGIEEKYLKRIFDPFFTTKRNTGGTGLGLSISYNIVKNHGGELRIESRQGEGTTCRLILPIERKVKEE